MSRSTQPITCAGAPRDGEFDPAAMLALVEQVLQRFPLVRIVGHMNFPDAPRKTWDDWTSYEARLNPVLSKQPGAVVCAYETSKCDGRQVMDLLRTDPVVIIGGSARSNPFFAPPDEFLVALRDRVASGVRPERADVQHGAATRDRGPRPAKPLGGGDDGSLSARA